MFMKDNFKPLHKAGSFTVWHYDAETRAEAGAARAQLGYFSGYGINPGDVIYITGGGETFHGWLSLNAAEDRLSVLLFGG